MNDSHLAFALTNMEDCLSVLKDFRDFSWSSVGQQKRLDIPSDKTLMDQNSKCPGDHEYCVISSTVQLCAHINTYLQIYTMHTPLLKINFTHSTLLVSYESFDSSLWFS